MRSLTFAEFQALAKAKKRIFVFQQMSNTDLCPMNVYHNLSKKDDGSCLFETNVCDSLQESYSFIGLDPQVKIEHKAGMTTMHTEKKLTFFQEHPFKVLEQCYLEYEIEDSQVLPSCFGSFIGFMSYDAVRLFENIPQRHNSSKMPILSFQLYQTMIVFDHKNDVLTIGTCVEAKGDLKKIFQKTHNKINRLIAKMQKKVSFSASKKSSSSIETDLSDEKFRELVQCARSYLAQGDIFQVVLSRTFSKTISVSALSFYKTLRSLNPSPYHFLLNFEMGVIVGASPEKLISLHQGTLETVPIAGTIPLKADGKNEEREENLRNDAKENAEHMMLVDLARNDLGIVAKPGTVKLVQEKILQRFSHVAHLTSVIEAQLKDEMNGFDALRAAFPAGTLSGAPKIRAMEIIDELENSSRGLYGGAICSFGVTGCMDSCLAIRTAVIKEGVAYVRAGAGIVLDSDPQKEADETRHKARAVLEAIRMSEEGHACNY